MSKVKITLVKSLIKRPSTQKNTVKALGLRKLHSTIEKEATPVVQGMIDKVKHLLLVEEV